MTGMHIHDGIFKIFVSHLALQQEFNVYPQIHYLGVYVCLFVHTCMSASVQGQVCVHRQGIQGTA